MRNLRSTPTDMVFFAVYARLAATIRRSGWIAQVISGIGDRAD